MRKDGRLGGRLFKDLRGITERRLSTADSTRHLSLRTVTSAFNGLTALHPCGATLLLNVR